MTDPRPRRKSLGNLRAWIRVGLAGGLLACSGPVFGQDVEPAYAPPNIAADDASWQLFEDPFANTIYDSPFFAPPVAGYAADTATTPTKFELPILEFPGTVNTVTQDLIRDRSSITFGQALRTVPNVTAGTGDGFRTDELFIRGFAVGANDFRKDGLRDSSLITREVQNIERIEVLKGPASALYGSASQPAGVINVITKKPLNTRFADADVMFGSYGLFRTVGDVNTPLFGNENVLGRLNYAIQDSESFRDFVFVDRQFVAPSLTFVLDDQTTLTVQGEYLHDNRPVDRGLVFLPNTPAGNPFAAPINTFYGQPTDVNNYNDGQVNVFLNRQVDDFWFGRVGYVSNWSDEQRSNYDTRGVIGNIVTRRYVQSSTQAQDHSVVADLTGEVEGPLFTHRVLVGTEIGTTINDAFARNSVVTGFPVNAFNPSTTPGANYGLYPAVPTLGAPLTSGSQVDQYGVYLQDLIEFNSYFKGLVGVRGNWYDTQFTTNGARADQSWQAWTPRYGLVFEPYEDALSFFAAYSETFNPVQGLQTDGVTPLVPESGWGVDLGAKARVLDQLWLTLTYFDNERTNIAQAVPATNPQQFTQFGYVRSRGFELELFGQLTERWSIMNGFGTVDARIENDRVPANIGRELPNAPNWQGSLWTRYNVIQDSDRTLGGGFGMLYTDSWFISADNLYQLPGYTRFDAAVYYDVGRWRTAVFVENFTDIRYAASGANNLSVLPGAPLTVRATAGVSF